MKTKEALEFLKKWDPSPEGVKKLFEAIHEGMKALERQEEYGWHDMREGLPTEGNADEQYLIWG